MFTNIINNFINLYNFFVCYIKGRLKADLLNTIIFPLLVSGLADASPTIRELTVRVSHLPNHKVIMY